MNWLIKIRMLLVVACLAALIGCGYGIRKKERLIVLPESRVGISHPTKPNYECYSTGYIREILVEIAVCLSD